MARYAFMKSLSLSVSVGGLLLAAMGPAQAASGDRIGESVVITNVVMADFAEKQRKLAKGDEVRQDESIEVNTDAQGEFRLDDETKLALGPGSRLVLDKFVYDSDKKAGSIVVNMMKGAFRFITGAAAKTTYVINTPNASITVRGTIFDVYILPDRSVWVLLHEGALEATGNRPVRALQRLRAALCDAERAALLGVEVGAPVLYIERRGFLADGRVIEATTSWYRGDAYDFVAELDMRG